MIIINDKKNIRGKDFRNDSLKNVSFQCATTGLSQTWNFWLHFIVIFLAIIVGIISAYAGALAAAPTANDSHGNLIYNPAHIGISLIFSAITFLIVWQCGINGVLASGSVVFASIAIAAIAFIPDRYAQDTVSILFAAMSLAGLVAAFFNMSLSIAISKALASKNAFFLSLFFAVLGTVLGSLFGVKEKSSEWAYLSSVAFGLTTLALGAYAGQEAMNSNRKYQLIRTITLALYTRGGTNFRGVDLTDVDFTGASLEGADFRGAILTRTCWYQAKNLDRALTTGTYLANPQIRQLVVTKDASNLPSFDHFDLREVNLADAKLQKASFISADLSQANLSGADLSGSKLAKAQLYQADLTRAILTGTNIQDWGISTETKLDDVLCDYIYMRLPTENDPDVCRKPDIKHEIFKFGDFANFISPIVKTLKLYQEQNVDMRQASITFKTLDLFHTGGLDPNAAAVALQQLTDNYPNAGLEVVILEGRGNENIHLQAKVSGDADRSQLSSEYFDRYEQLKSLPYGDVKRMLTAMVEKDERIQSYKKLLENAQKQPEFYVKTSQNTGNTIMSNKKILVLAASPEDQVRLNLEKEFKVIDVALRLGKNREQFTLDQRWGISRGELQDILWSWGQGKGVSIAK
jgi:uncharacterized protein YjbI with pentapeptide repeats